MEDMTRPLDRHGVEGAIKDTAGLNDLTSSSRRSPTTPIKVTSLQKPAWNTENLSWRVTSDLTAAAVTSSVVSPIITMIDRGIIERAASRNTLMSSIMHSCTQLLTRPHLFLASKPFLLIYGLYFGTFLTANAVDTLKSTLDPRKSASTASAGPSKFAAVSAVNMSLCLYKDSQFTKMFSSTPANTAGGAAKAAVPVASYALFAIRDSLTVFASFNLPPLIAPLLPQFSKEVEARFSRQSAAQFLAPAGMQLLSTPLHLWGLDLYNRPAGNGVGWRKRVRRVGRDWLGSSFARMGRIVPAFGAGGVINNGLRRRMIEGPEV